MYAIISPRHTSDAIKLLTASHALGYHAVRPLNWRIEEEIKEKILNEEVFVYGETLFCAVVAEQIQISLIEPVVDLLTTLPQKYLKRKVECITLAEAKNLCGELFIKPADDKCFAAKVYYQGQDIEVSELVSLQTPVIVSEPVKWLGEFRFFIKERKILSHSIYSFEGNLCEDSLKHKDDERLALKLAEEIVSDPGVLLPPAVCMDVGVIYGRGAAVVEFNSCTSSGIYSCNPLGVIEVLKRACVRRAEKEDLKWVLKREWNEKG